MAYDYEALLLKMFIVIQILSKWIVMYLTVIVSCFSLTKMSSKKGISILPDFLQTSAESLKTVTRGKVL